MEIFEILKKALAGDSEAWDEVFDRLWPVVAGVAASLMHGADAAAIEDAAQNTFVRLTEDDSRRLRAYDPGRATVEKYVAKIAHNCTLDFLRAQTRRSRNASQLPPPEEKNDNLSERIFPWELTAALGVLAPREREVIEMLYFDHLDTAEIADRLGIGADTVRSLKSHAMQKLRKYFDC